ncbi:MAG: PQQ-binding-like beta-propeller repeat protein, partial [Candidatus Zixiibacteriota bacterium]
AGSEDNHVYAIDGESGLEIWSTISFPSDIEEMELAQMNGVGPLDVVAAIGGSSGKMVVIDGSNGDVLWEYGTNTAYAQHVEVLDADDDGILDVAIGVQKVGATPGRLIVVNGDTHTELWTVTPFLPTIEYGLGHGDLNGDKAEDLVAGGNSDDKTIYAFNGLNGAPLWDYLTGGEVNVVLVHEVTGDSIPDVLAGSDDQYLYVLNGNDGSLFFDYSTAGDVMHIQVGDISGDGVPNVACVTFDSDGIAYVFKSFYEAGCCNHDGIRLSQGHRSSSDM